MGSNSIVYDYSDVPTLKRFSQDNSRNRGVMGPFGSGKSSAMVMEIMQRSQQQMPDPEGRRCTRWLVVRSTFPQLRDTTIKTFHDWIPPRYFGTWRDTFHEFVIDKIFLPDGTQVVSEVLFRALDRPDHVRNLLSLELTGAWVNEAREIPKAIIDVLDGRIDRYPAMRVGGPTWTGIFMDTNPPDVDHWWYRIFEKECPPGHAIFKQPSGRGPDAENLSHLKAGYYQNLMIGKDPEFIKVYVDGQYGFVMDGQVVFLNWNDTLHVPSKKIAPIPGLPLLIGFDFGVRNPAAVICQYHPSGLFNVLEEVVSENIGIRQFANDILKPILVTTYAGYPVVATGDPSGTKKADTDERTCYMELRDARIPATPARSNSLEARINAVNQFLTRMIRGKISFQLSPNCLTLRKGFNGGYHYRRMQVGGDERFYNIPEKNKFSHPMDALQYATMYVDSSLIVQQQRTMQLGPYNPDQLVSSAAWT